MLYGIILDDADSMDSLMELHVSGMILACCSWRLKATPADIKLLEDRLENLRSNYLKTILRELYQQMMHFMKLWHLLQLAVRKNLPCNKAFDYFTAVQDAYTYVAVLKQGAEEVYRTHVEMLNAIKNKDIHNAGIVGKAIFMMKAP